MINSNLVNFEIKCTATKTTRFSLKPLNHTDQTTRSFGKY